MRIHTKPTAVEIDIGADAILLDQYKGELRVSLVRANGAMSDVLLGVDELAEFLRAIAAIMEG